MANVDPLAQLADIQEPALQAFWYERPLIWIAILVLLALLSWLLLRRYRHYQQQAPRREALALLQQLPDDYTASELTEVLKRYLKARQVDSGLLSATPAQLQQFLSRHGSDITWPDLMALHYQRLPDREQLRWYRQSLTKWLAQHPWILS